jgi:Family of unknown function (DUF6152)
MRQQLAILSAVLLLAAGNQASAHHSFQAEFDIDKPVEFTGTVTKVELINPHSWIHLSVVGKDGRKVDWMIEGGAPNALFRRGITKKSVPIGAEIYIKGFQARDGSNRAVGEDIKFADGRPLFFGAKTPNSPK